jgi:hypothetical protein
MPKATSLTPAAVGDAAQQLRVPQGGLPNGSGVAFGPPGTRCSMGSRRRRPTDG